MRLASRDILRQCGEVRKHPARHPDLQRQVKQRETPAAPTASSQRGPNRNGSTISPASAYSVRMSPFHIRHKMNQSERQQHDEPAHQQHGAARACRKPLELDGKPDAEQQREQRKRLQVDRQRQDGFDGAVERRCGMLCGRETVRRSKRGIRGDVDRHHAEQRDAAQHVDGIDPLGGVYRPRAT